jgi:hypothetical protein
MIIPVRVAVVLVLLRAFTADAHAQAPPTPAPAPEGAQANTNVPYTAPQPLKRQSIVHHYPYPYPGAYHGDSSGGFRNPGGTGRFLEYYPPGNQFQLATQQDVVRVAKFGGGGIPDRNEQLAAQQVGISRYNAIQGHIDNMARPAFGYGFFGGMY